MRKLAWFALPFAAAVFLRVYLLPDEIMVPLGALMVLVSVVAIMLRKAKNIDLRIPIAAAGICIALLWCGIYETVHVKPIEELAGQTLDVSVEVTDFAKPTEYGVQVKGRMVQEGGHNARVVLYLKKGFEGLEPGYVVDTTARLADAGTIMGEENDYYYSLGIHLKATAQGDAAVTEPEVIPLQYFPKYLMLTLKLSLARLMPPDVTALAAAVVTGDKNGLGDAFYSALQRCGLAHIVAVSGMHLSFLVGLVNTLFRRRRRYAAVLSLVVVVLFTLMAGATPAVVRAAIMQILLLLAPLLGRDYDPLTALSAALLLLLLHNPYSAASMSLQMSFGAVLGIILVSERLKAKLCEKAKVEFTKGKPLNNLRCHILYALFGTISVSLGAMVFTLPLTAVHFRSVAILSPVANLLTLWAVEFLFIFGLLGGIIGVFVPLAGAVLVLPAWAGGRYLLGLVPKFASIPFVSVPILSFYMAAWLLLVYALLALNIFWKGEGKKRPGLSALICAAALVVVILVNGSAFNRGDMTVSVLDVGQGQSVVVRTGSYCALVDCGGNSWSDPGDVAADYLLSIGRTRLDFLVVTHYHEDHANGIPELLRRVNVDTLLVPDVEPESKLRHEILKMAQEKGIKVKFVVRTARVKVGDGLDFVVYPPLGNEGTNELGLSVLASTGEYDALITGDMSSKLEQVLVQNGHLPDIELLVVGHHGSRYSTSEELLYATRPETAIISVGYNTYGHPTQEVLDRLDDIGATVYRTDLNGTVTVNAGMGND